MKDDLSRAAQLEAIMADVPIVQTLGMRCDIKGDDMSTILPFQEKLLGNIDILALHGGAIATFLEMTAMAQLFLSTDTLRPARTINTTLDFLRQGRTRDVYARARVVKLGRRMASVSAEAWQSERDKPIATLTGHFLLDHSGQGQSKA